jgi:hypothetical protein
MATPTAWRWKHYPGLLARLVLGARPYKSDDRAKQTPEQLIARKYPIEALEQGRTWLALRSKVTHAQCDVLIDDASDDRLDAVPHLVQAGMASGQLRYGLPIRGVDCLCLKCGTPVGQCAEYRDDSSAARKKPEALASRLDLAAGPGQR